MQHEAVIQQTKNLKTNKQIHNIQNKEEKKLF